MKNETEIKARIAELRDKLENSRTSINPDRTIMGRLEGNIGALEWVLRKD